MDQRAFRSRPIGHVCDQPHRGGRAPLRVGGLCRKRSTTHAARLSRGRGTRHGKTLDNPTCLRMRLNERGQIVEVWEFVWDLYHVDDFWS